MIGIVVVSHSPALAKAAVDLALEMVPGTKPAISIAAGAGDGLIGTDAEKVSASIDEVAGPDGVLVMMDLGSSVMSGEMALEFRESECEVRLSSAPFVEGLLAAIVTASGGGSLADADREATASLVPKQSMLGAAVEQTPAVAETVASDELSDEHSDEHSDELSDELSDTLEMLNPDGLHARPAATLATAIAAFDAKVMLANLDGSAKPVAGNSLIGIMSLGVKKGDRLGVSASGVQASEALATIHELVDTGFGEL